ncbi:rho GTPase-activating protein 24-like [Boleophthalmus pectinirostris]|uniref:rho GTPase-activating protein 24-like n=1 Tax=Boleophthalmus pectinirostris TaxID=150288 RepID=UPI00242CFF15|nr:rho GTPase-activating protein 24-like [Boleophthalmus pectinirostris]
MGLSCFKSWKHDRTRHKGNRDVLASPGSYFFLSNSAGQGDEWLKTLNKGAWIPFTGVFGQRLEETVLYERKYGVRLVPLVVEQCVNFIRDRGLHEVGLFRQPGQTRMVQALRQAYDSGERPMFDSSTDVHTVASLLKLYLRQLPEPLVPYSHYQHFLQCGRKLSTDRTRGLVELRYLLHELPVANFNLLNFICQFLNEVQSYSSSNKMSCQNLATVFGPNILRSKAEDPQSIVGGAALVQVLMLEFIREYHSLFSKVPPPSLRPPVSPYSAPCLRQMSLPLITEKDSEAGQSSVPKSEFYQKKLLGHRHTSSHPETCMFLAPGSSSPYNNVNLHHHGDQQGHSVPLPLLKPDGLSWTEAWSDLRDPNVDYWTPDAPNEGLASLSGGSSISNGISTPSAYDNIEKENSNSGSFENVQPETAEQPQNLEEEQNEESSTSWSSCEIIPLEESLSPAPSAKRHTSLPVMELKDLDNEGEEPFESLHYTTPTSRSEPSISPLSTGSSEVFLPSGPPELQDQEGQMETSEPRDTHSLLVELQRQLARQREEYQARIQRLERCNDVLERQITVLRLTLEQQKRSQSVAETQLKHMECAKADADRRNHKLQQEMDRFFEMCGEIRNSEEDETKEEKPRTRVLQSL